MLLATLALSLAAPQDVVPSVVLRAGLPLPGGPGNEIVSLVLSPRSNPAGDFGCFVSLNGGFSRAIYSEVAGEPTVIKRQFTPGALEEDWQYTDEVTYLAWEPGPCSGPAIRQGETLLLCDGDPSPLAGRDYILQGFVGILGAGPNGEFFVQAVVEPTQPGGAPYIALRGPSMTPVLLVGDTLPGIGPAVTTVTNLNASARASHWCALPRLDNPNADDRVLVVDGVPPLVQGLPVRAGNLVAATSGSTERWFRLRGCAVDESGSWMVEGTTIGAGPAQVVVMRDGEIVLREGDVIDGLTLLDQLYYHGFGADGSEILIWLTESPTTSPQTALFVDRKLVLTQGEAIDADGDGVADPGWVFESLTVNSGPFPIDPQVDIDEDGVLRVVGTVQAANSLFHRALLEIPLGTGQTTCEALPNSTGFGATLVGTGTARVAENAFGLRAAQLPPGQFGYFLNGPMEALPVPGGTQGNLCLGGPIGRILASTGLTSPSGELDYTLDLDALPRPTGTVMVQPGDTWFFQCWFRDVGGTSEFSSGLRVSFR